MFKMLCVFATFFTVFSAENGLRGSKVTTLDVNVDEVEVWSQFTNFQERFSKKYESISELEERFQVFRTNFKQIITHNLDFTQNFTIPCSPTNNKMFDYWYSGDVLRRDNSQANAYNANIRVDAYIEVNQTPFRYGSLQLDSAKLKNGVPNSYLLARRALAHGCHL